jgi:hypothetical protein
VEVERVLEQFHGRYPLLFKSLHKKYNTNAAPQKNISNAAGDAAKGKPAVGAAVRV